MKIKTYSLVSILLVSIIIAIIFRAWFLNTEIIGGDWLYLSQTMVNNYTPLPPAWSATHGNGFGGTIISYALDSYLYNTGWFFSHILGIPWQIVSKIFWFGMFLFLSIFSSIVLLRTIFPKRALWQELLTALIYTSNTYILLVTGGGQMGVALGYAVAPLVLASFLRVMTYKTITTSLLAGLLFSLQVLFDFRIAYVTVVGVGFVFILSRIYEKKVFKSLSTAILYTFVIPITISVLLHLYWLLPLLIAHQSPTASLGTSYTSIDSVRFFSFATIENAIGLLHPYWPENIFGKVGFMKPEFLLLGIFAFGSLLVFPKQPTHKEIKKYVLLMASITLVGIFLAKGANDPFGQFYLWAFDTIPGFIMFRDPTKWYVLIALGYSMLVPYFLFSISSYLKKDLLKFFLTVAVLIYFGYLLYPALSGQLGKTFQSHTVPKDYILLENKLNADTTFSRTLWIPHQSRFTFGSYMHPSVEGEPLLHATNSAIFTEKLQEEDTQKLFELYGIKYVIVPTDSLEELFITDRKYDEKKRKAYITVLKQVPWLHPVGGFTDLVVFQTERNNPLFSLNEKGNVLAEESTSDAYTIHIATRQKNTLVMSENYHPDWKLYISGETLSPKKTTEGFLSFEVPAGTYQAELVFSQKYWYTIGLIVSLISFILLLGAYFMLQYRDFFIYLKNTF